MSSPPRPARRASGAFLPDTLPGFFGKVPARGDFLSRRVPPGVASAWEAWLATLTAAARASAGEGWPEAWLTAPVWHFALGSALAPPHGTAGVLVASADRVGRLFPFTLIGASDPARSGESDALARWDQEAETLTIGALNDGFDPTSLDSALARLGPPPGATGSDRPPGVEALLGKEGWSGATALPGPDQSVWWSRGSNRVVSVRLRCAGLPGEATAAAMILGGAAASPGSA